MMQRAADRTNEDTHTLSDVNGSVYTKFQVKPNLKGSRIYRCLSYLPIIGKYSSYFDLKMIRKDLQGEGEGMKQRINSQLTSLLMKMELSSICSGLRSLKII